MRLQRLLPLEDERALLAAQRLADLVEGPQVLAQLSATCRLRRAHHAVEAVVVVVLLVLAAPSRPLNNLCVTSANTGLMHDK